ncbi:MAG: high-affinity nickel-transporter [Rhizobium sp.]|nr:high-affinity nickel-transporter [Rhizobium sp.]
MLQIVIDIQRDIYLALAEHIKAFAAGGSWAAFLGFLPLGIVFGAVHAMTPGHSKSILATYLTGSSAGVGHGLLVSLALSFTHVTTAVLIAWFSLPLVSRMLGSAGDTPALENISRGLLGLIGLWMLWSAFFRHPHVHGDKEGLTVGMMAGLIPCPLTLFVMTFSMSRGVPVAGLLFAVVMMLGVIFTLSLTALTVVVFRQQVVRLLAARPRLISGLSKSIEAVAGFILVAIAIREILLR